MQTNESALKNDSQQIAPPLPRVGDTVTVRGTVEKTIAGALYVKFWNSEHGLAVSTEVAAWILQGAIVNVERRAIAVGDKVRKVNAGSRPIEFTVRAIQGDEICIANPSLGLMLALAHEVEHADA